MKDKYYTPTIEEFHVGFEYEALEVKDNTWNKDTFTEKDKFPIFKTGIELGWLRVKHLDREDIESVGFKLEKEASEHLPGDLFQMKAKNPHGEDATVCIYFVYSTNWAVVYWAEATGGNYMLTVNIPELRTASNNAFAGRISNKSELKRILNQIGVL